MKRLATLLVAAAGLALMLVAFISNFSTAWAWGWRHYYPCYGGYRHHYPPPIIPIGAAGIVGLATAGISRTTPLQFREMRRSCVVCEVASRVPSGN